MKDRVEIPDAQINFDRSFDKQAEALTLNRRNARRLAKRAARKAQRRAR